MFISHSWLVHLAQNKMINNIIIYYVQCCFYQQCVSSKYGNSRRYFTGSIFYSRLWWEKKISFKNDKNIIKHKNRNVSKSQVHRHFTKKFVGVTQVPLIRAAVSSSHECPYWSENGISPAREYKNKRHCRIYCSKQIELFVSCLQTVDTISGLNCGFVINIDRI